MTYIDVVLSEFKKFFGEELACFPINNIAWIYISHILQARFIIDSSLGECALNFAQPVNFFAHVYYLTQVIIAILPLYLL